jgi:hypothetical protein
MGYEEMGMMNTYRSHYDFHYAEKKGREEKPHGQRL